MMKSNCSEYRADQTIHMGLQKLYENITMDIEDCLFLYKCNPECFDISGMAIEVIARLFVLSFGRVPKEGFAFGTLYSFCNEGGSKSSGNRHSMNSDKKYYGERRESEADLRTMQRNEKNIRSLYKGSMRQLPFYQDIPDATKMENTRKGRKYDKANLIMIHEKFELKTMIEKNMICSSKSVPAEKAADAYIEFDNQYRKLQETAAKADAYEKVDGENLMEEEITLKADYIFHWVNDMRMETAYHLSLISQLAQKMQDHDIKELPGEYIQKIFGRFWMAGHLFEPYQILSHLKWAEHLCTFQSPEEFESFEDFSIMVKIAESMAVSNCMNNEAVQVFMPFFKETAEGIRTMYEFCRRSYPIIQGHPSGNLYEDEQSKKLNHSKIKRVRELIEVLISPEDIKAMSNLSPKQ